MIELLRNDRFKQRKRLSDLRFRLEHWARSRGHLAAFSFMERGEDVTRTLTYSRLYGRANSIGRALADASLGGKPAILLYPSGLDFIEALFGCFLAGAIAVPVPYPTNKRAWTRIKGIMRTSQAVTVLTVTQYELDGALRTELQTDDRPVPWISTDAIPDSDDVQGHSRSLDDLALLQFTSGSTSAPKGVRVTFGNLHANHQMIAPSFGANPDEPIVTWLPMFHDMGLIGTVLYALYAGRPVYLMPPFAFLKKPKRWLAAISRFGASTSGAPNFAYDLCTRAINRGNVDDLALGHWNTAFCGAEPVRAATLRAFCEAFAPVGFRPSALLPCYGLAEVTLLASARPTLRMSNARSDAVSCGRGCDGQTLVIVADGLPQPDGTEGEIWIAGPHTSLGYWRDSAETDRTFGHTLPTYPGLAFVRTGDLGFLEDGELFVTGRIKDLVIVRGIKHHINDLVSTAAAASPDLVHGAGTVLTLEVSGRAHVVVMQEVRRHAFADLDHEALSRAVSSALIDNHGVRPDRVVSLREGTLPRTTSGKLQRPQCRALLDALDGADLRTDAAMP